ncbi:MAG: hypothetical protein BWY93_01135 [Euryarchaeota archaeon ADurb.BinA087]|nr:MAG: hypothetical protein BWY93_01135 [Euryarchaeota archaeon ADurb.BinA087]
MHGLHLFVAMGKGKGLAQIKGVLHLPCRVVLRLEESIEVPVALLDDLPIQFLKPHREKDFTHLTDDPLVRVYLPGIEPPWQLLYIIAPEFNVPPCA